MEWLWVVVGIVLVGLWIRYLILKPKRIVANSADIQIAIMDARKGLRNARSFKDIIDTISDTLLSLKKYALRTQVNDLFDRLCELSSEAVHLHFEAYEAERDITDELSDFYDELKAIYTKVYFGMFKGIDFGVPKTLPRVIQFIGPDEKTRNRLKEAERRSQWRAKLEKDRQKERAKWDEINRQMYAEGEEKMQQTLRHRR